MLDLTALNILNLLTARHSQPADSVDCAIHNNIKVTGGAFPRANCRGCTVSEMLCSQCLARKIQVPFNLLALVGLSNHSSFPQRFRHLSLPHKFQPTSRLHTSSQSGKHLPMYHLLLSKRPILVPLAAKTTVGRRSPCQP